MLHYPRVSEDFLQRWAIDWIDVKQRMDQVFYFCGTKKQDKKHKLMLTSSFSQKLEMRLSSNHSSKGKFLDLN